MVPGPVTVNVAFVIVAGFMALLKVAVIRTVLGQTSVDASGGVTEVTVGGVKGSVGLPVPAFLSGSLQLPITMSNKNSGIQILPTFNLDISFSPSESTSRAEQHSLTLKTKNWRRDILRCFMRSMLRAFEYRGGLSN